MTQQREPFQPGQNQHNGRRILVIGYGNTLRRDDAAGVRAAEAVEALGLPGVQVRISHQLNPELAEDLAQADTAVFLDARPIDGTRRVDVKEIEPRAGASCLAHTGDPEYLLHLSSIAYGKTPQAWMVTLPAADFSVGEGLSATTIKAVGEAIQIVQGICLGKPPIRRE
ncbi:MAG: hydrogenase maturation protease [Chthonomonadales bacterium]